MRQDRIKTIKVMKRHIMAAMAALAFLPTVAWGGNIFDNLTYYARLGYNLGGTAPVGMPATIRSLDKFTPKANGTIALDAYKPLNGRWGLIAGFHVESKGMKTDAKVKNYHMEIRQGGEKLLGLCLRRTFACGQPHRHTRGPRHR